MAHNPFIEFIKLYRNDPALFVKEVLGVEPDDWQKDFLNAVATGERKISIRSGHGVGKSTTASWAMLWFLLTRYPVKVVVTAPTSAQLYDALFAELKRWVKELPKPIQDLLDVKQERIELKASATEAFISSGFFFDTHNRLKDEWWTRRVSCLDSTRVSKEYVEDMKSRYGEESNAYRIRVLGEFPRSDDDTIIPMELLESAKHRDTRAYEDAPIVWGLDVARFGSDSSVLCKRQSNVVHTLERWRNLDLMQLTGAVVAQYEACDHKSKPTEILVDSIGLGAGVVDRLRELKLPCRGINVSESPAMGGTYLNLRAELWHKTKAWLEKRDCKIPNNEDFIAELATVRYTFTSNGKIKIESKDDIRRRGLKSPDMADAFVLTFASDAATVSWGSNMSWGKPIKRLIRGLV
jgi:hypothetical protein